MPVLLKMVRRISLLLLLISEIYSRIPSDINAGKCTSSWYSAWKKLTGVWLSQPSNFCLQKSFQDQSKEVGSSQRNVFIMWKDSDKALCASPVEKGPLNQQRVRAGTGERRLLKSFAEPGKNLQNTKRARRWEKKWLHDLVNKATDVSLSNLNRTRSGDRLVPAPSLEDAQSSPAAHH